MLFLGTEKFPEENAYNSFLTEHGGFSNVSLLLSHPVPFSFVAWPASREDGVNICMHCCAGICDGILTFVSHHTARHDSTSLMRVCSLTPPFALGTSFNQAFTSSSDTNYYFDVAPAHLEGALDRFCEFFMGPLFTEVRVIGVVTA
jgi:hypothetical protein